MEIKFDVIKILAVGCEKRFMWVRFTPKKPYKPYIKCFKIDDFIYGMLKEKGVPTSQSLRKKND